MRRHITLRFGRHPYPAPAAELKIVCWLISWAAKVGFLLQDGAYFMVVNQSKTLQDLCDNSPE
jgi:hypothetical protein